MASLSSLPASLSLKMSVSDLPQKEQVYLSSDLRPKLIYNTVGKLDFPP